MTTNRYKITKAGPSFWRREEGEAVQYNASSRNIVELTLEDYRKHQGHLGLVIAGKAKPVEIDAEGVADQNDPQEPPQAEEGLPEDWKELPKARKAALYRKFLKESASGLNEDQLNEALEAYGSN